MADSKVGCPECAANREDKFCSQCGRNIHCRECEAFVEPNSKFCKKCGNKVTKAGESTSNEDRSVCAGGSIGVVISGNNNQGNTTAYVHPKKTEAGDDTMSSFSKKFQKETSSKQGGNRSVYAGEEIGAVVTGDDYVGDIKAHVNQEPNEKGGIKTKSRENIGFPRNRTSQGEMRKTDDDTSDIEYHEKVSELSKSVGCVWSPVCTGTGFMIGPQYFITCWHVIRDIIDDMRETRGEKDITRNSNVWVQFNYKPGEEKYPSEHRFQLDCISYYNTDLDYVIIKLDTSTGAPPAPIKRFSRPGKNDKLHVIGHSRGLCKKLDPDCFFDSPTPEVVAKCQNDLEEFLDKEWVHFRGDCYQGLERDRRLRFHSTFQKGASGSPGAVRRLDGLSVVTMFARGYPGFYYGLTETKQKELDLPNSFFIEEGIDFMTVLEDIQTKRPDIYKDLELNTT